MASEMTQEVLEMIEAEANSRPTPFEFELAYQARVAIDRLKFAIKHAEQFCPRSDALREAGLQLFDALGRLESVERRFQQRSRSMPVDNIVPDSNESGNPYKHFIKPKIFCYHDFNQKEGWKAEIDLLPFVEVCDSVAALFA